ncbi:hypothetical protein [Leifsonia sp. Leaf264]|uniref:hypothetical protein n=1 Tax=Leifsonia sp. Leaf264 TaxID=1736314 RepID=UPI0006FD7B8B|nr:hypothetical protein [Leifsonia sp. Leaf264]KQO98395.1 hypothetical protein ASF30_10060 [Leifsonia sp. Leaf264]
MSGPTFPAGFAELREARNAVDKIRRYAQKRLDAGDLDFDDWVTRTRDAAAEAVADIDSIARALGWDDQSHGSNAKRAIWSRIPGDLHELGFRRAYRRALRRDIRSTRKAAKA